MPESQLAYIYGPAASAKGILRIFLDGHPELAVHPNHDKIPNGIASVDSWDDIDDDRYFYELRNALASTGYYRFEDYAHKRDIGIVTTADEYTSANHRIELDFYEAERDWANKLITERPDSTGDIILTLFKSLFDYWPEYPNNVDDYKYYVGMGTTRPDPMTSLVANSDDVRVLFIERDPRAVVASHGARPTNSIDTLIMRGRTYRAKENIQAAKDLKSQYPDQVKILSFRDLILRTDETMSEVADFLDIEDSQKLHTPTFCGHELKPRDNYVGEIKDEWEELVSSSQRCALDLQMGENPNNINIRGIRLFILSKIVHKGIRSYSKVGELGRRWFY